MTALLIVSLLLSGSVPLYRMPSTSDTCEIIVVMMEDGLLPQTPWEGISSYQREEFWTLACGGMMIQRAGWSGYIMICPIGIGEMILETAESLATARGISDSSMLRIGLQLEPAAPCPSTVLFFSNDGDDDPPESLPLRTSIWLQQEADTVMLSSDIHGNSFFWTDLPDSVSLSPAGWRGVGTEIVPTGNGSVRLAYTAVHGSVPSNLSSIRIDSHPVDDFYMKTWGSAISAVDSLIKNIYPLSNDPGHLLWIRGSGLEHPWRMAPSPSPPVSAEFEISSTQLQPPVTPVFNTDPSLFPSATQIVLPGRLSSFDNHVVMEIIIERILGREVMTLFDDDVFFDVVCSYAGEVSVWLVRDGRGQSSRDSDSLTILEALREASLVPPGIALVRNASTRASFTAGHVLTPTDVRTVSMELMNVLFTD